MSARPSFRFVLIPWGDLLFGLSSLLVGIASAILFFYELAVGGGELLPPGAVALILLALSWILFRNSGDTLGVLTVADTIRDWRPTRRLEASREAARCVRITRRPRAPVRYILEIRQGRGSVEIVFAQHTLFTGHLEDRARALARALAVPVEDPTGDAGRTSSWWIVRALSTGQEWKVVVLVIAMVLALGAWQAAWRSSPEDASPTQRSEPEASPAPMD